MQSPQRTPGTAGRISELTAEGARLWVARGERLSHSLWLMGIAIVLFVGAQLLGALAMNMVSDQSPDMTRTVMEVMNAAIIIGPAAMLFTSCALFIDSLRLRFKVEKIDTEMRRLDPEERLLTSWPEEFGRDIRAALDARRD